MRNRWQMVLGIGIMALASIVAVLLLAVTRGDKPARAPASTGPVRIIPVDAAVAQLPRVDAALVIDALVIEAPDPKIAKAAADLEEKRFALTKVAHDILGFIVNYDDTTIFVPNEGGTCNARTLINLRDHMRAKGKDPGLVFDTLACGDGTDDEIDLHTKTGCKPEQRELLVVSEAGAKRQAAAEGVGVALNTMRDGYLLGAAGCDATTMTITLIAGFDNTCDFARLISIKHDSDGAIRRLGFTKLWCYPNTDEIEL